MKYKWLLFDADGTLFDYDKAEAAALRSTFGDFEVDFSATHHRKYRQINSGLFKDFEQGLVSSKELRSKRFALLFPEFDIHLDVESFSNKYLMNLSKESTLTKGALDIIRALYPRFKMLLVTNGITDVQRVRFEHSALRPYFMDIIISDEAGAAKPSPEFFNAAFKTMGNPKKSEVLLIGDSLTADMAGGIDYGIDTCWFNPGKLKNENRLKISYEISGLDRLLEVVEGSW